MALKDCGRMGPYRRAGWRIVPSARMARAGSLSKTLIPGEVGKARTGNFSSSIVRLFRVCQKLIAQA